MYPQKLNIIVGNIDFDGDNNLVSARVLFNSIFIDLLLQW